MKSLILSFFILFLGIAENNTTTLTNSKLESCFFNGKKLYGKIQFVATPGEADIKVKIVNSFADIKIKFVESNPNSCGMWQVVETGADLKVYITENFPDLKIKPVISFPGITQ